MRKVTMAFNPRELDFLCKEIDDGLFGLITHLQAAEAAIFDGSPEVQELLDFIGVADTKINELDTAYAILQYSKAHGRGSLSRSQMAQALPYDPAIVAEVLNQLIVEGILSPCTS